MQNSITWFDQLRSRLTGQPAKFYATRRLARADLHVLEAQRAHAVARLTEDIELIDRYVNPLERYMDGDRLLTPLGTILDRRSGKNLPLVWTELDLREFRRWARVICDVNPFAVGFLGLLTDFHIRQGFGWRVVLRGARGMGQGASQNEASSLLAPRPMPLAPIQAVLDTWRDTSQWGIRSREAFRRWRRDGEVFIRFFRGGQQTNGLPAIRFVEPEQVGPPPGEDADGDWSFGILTEHEDVENVQAFFVRDPLGTGSEGDEVRAARILHLKANVDSSIKRGLPDFMPVQDDLERVRRMLRNMGEVASIQTAIAWVSQYATATADQVGTLIRAGSDYTRPKLGDPSGKYMDVVNYEPGTVLHMDSNRQFVAGPVAQGTAGFIQVEQAILRGCGARWRFPEYFSGDASNNNMASSIVAGSPFVVAVEGNQLEWGVFERAVAKKVLELCVESGRLSREHVASVDVKVIPPAVALANREEEERLREMRNKAGVLSVTTWQQQVGLDPKHEAANFEAEARRKGASEGGKTVGESEESECDEEISEGMLKGKKFTGEIRDSVGRRRCYYKGKQIPCKKHGQVSASSTEPTIGEPQAKKDTKDEAGVEIDGKKINKETIINEIMPKVKDGKTFRYLPTDEELRQAGSRLTAAQFAASLELILLQMAANERTFPFKTTEDFVNNAIFRGLTAIHASSLQNQKIKFAQGNHIATFPGSTNWKVKEITIDGKKVNGIVPTTKPSVAIREFTTDKAKNNATLDCATFAVVAHQLALLEMIGDKEFDAKFEDDELQLCGLLVRSENLGFFQVVREATPVIGDIVGFTYPKEVLEKLTPKQIDDLNGTGWRSENTIYVGPDDFKKPKFQLFVGHPLNKPESAEEILANQKKATGHGGNVMDKDVVLLYPGRLPPKEKR